MYFNGFKFLVDEIQPHDLKSQAIGLGGGSGSHPGKVGKAQLWGPLLLLGSPPPAQKPHRLGCLGWGVWHGSRNLRVPGQREGLGAQGSTAPICLDGLANGEGDLCHHKNLGE